MKKSGNITDSTDTDLGRIPRRLEAAGAAVVIIVAVALLAVFNIRYDTNIYIRIQPASDNQRITATISNSDTSALHDDRLYLMRADSTHNEAAMIVSAIVTEPYTNGDSSIIVLELSHSLKYTDNNSIYIVSRENLFRKVLSHIKQ